jgi:hypothetical protein
MNIIEGLAMLLEDAEPSDEALRAECLAAGIDIDAWADQIRADIRAAGQRAPSASGP